MKTLVPQLRTVDWLELTVQATWLKTKMPKSSIQDPDRVAPEQDVQGGFMFVAITGKKDQAQDKGARKQMRAHVMHNFRGKESKLNQWGRVEDGDRSAQQAGHIPTNVGQKLRFRLKDDGILEESVPLRQRGKKVRSRKDDKVAEGLPDEASEERQAVPTPDFESWTRQSSGDQPDFQLDSQPDFHLPFLSPPQKTRQHGAVTEGYFDKKAPTNFWDDVDATSTSKAIAGIRLPTSPLLPFGISRLDPLSVLPFALSRRDEEFIDRFRLWETDSWCPVNGRGSWFTFALRDKLLFNATMYHWGKHISLNLA